MPICVLHRAAKIHGTRYDPGEVVEVQDDVYEHLVESGAAGPLVAPPAITPTVKMPRSAAEKQAALVEAQARLAKSDA
jgi:hypothetical protein